MAAHLRGVRIHAGNAIAMLINPSTGGSAKLIAAVKNAASHWDCNEAHAAGDFEAASNNGRRRLERNRKFVDSPLEGTGFEPMVPP